LLQFVDARVHIRDGLLPVLVELRLQVPDALLLPLEGTHRGPPEKYQEASVPSSLAEWDGKGAITPRCPPAEAASPKA